MLIIDGDLYVYKAGFAHRGKEIGFKLIHRTTNEELDLGNISLTEARKKCESFNYSMEDWKLQHYNNPTPLEWVIGNLKTTLNGLLERFNNPPYMMFLTSSDYSNYRFDLATIKPYKGSRSKCVKCFERCTSSFDTKQNIVYNCKYCGEVTKDTIFSDKPHYYTEIRDYLVQHWNAVLVHGEEADDTVSYTATNFYRAGENVTMVHIDKDINNTPGWHYNPDTDTTYYINKDEALRNFYSQFLLGDSIDCIEGVKGCGKVITKELLATCETAEEYEQVIFDIFQGINIPVKRFKNTMNLNPDEAFARLTEIGQLLHIRQTEGELWQPTMTMV